MSTRRVVVLMLILALLVPVHASAQKRVLSLEDAIGTAIDQSTTVGTFRENVRSSRTGVLQSWGNFLPNATTSLYGGRSFIGPTGSVSFDSQGRPVQPSGFDFESYSFSINSGMSLFDWGASYKTLNNARNTAEASAYDLQYQKDIVTAITIRNYYDFVRMKRLRMVQEESVTAAERNLQQVEAFFKIGSNTRADVLQAKVRLGNTRLNLITAKNNEEIARATLASLLNFPIDEEFDVDMSLNIKPSNPDFDKEVQYMLTHRSDLEASRHRVRAANDNLAATKATRWPTLSATMSYSWNDREFADNFNFFKSEYNWSVGVFMSANIFDRFVTKSNIMSAKAQRRIAEYNLQQAKLDAILEAKRLYLLLSEANERISVSDETVVQARENLRLAEERYRVGAGTILETIEAGVSLTEAEAALIQAQCDYLIAKADLLRATGRGVTVD